MSIIQEALKKAEKESKQKRDKIPADIPAEVPAGQGTFAAPHSNAVKSHNLLLAFIAIIAVISFSAYFVSGAFRRVPPLEVSESAETPSAEKAEPVPLPGGTVAEGDKIPETSEGQRLPEDNPQETQAMVSQPPVPYDTGNLVVSGIMYSSRSPYAVINDSLLKEGDTADGFKIIKIHQKTVEIEKNGRVSTLQLKK